MKASDLFVKCLENEGVEYIFGIPGEENLALLDSISRSNIKFVLTRHEQAAGFMAATYGRLTGKAGVCLATLGPGATNLITSAAHAQLGGMPIVMITGQKPIKTNNQGQFQILDVVAMMSSVTKYSKQLRSIHQIPSEIRSAFKISQQERPGATHLELPEDIADEEFNESPIPVNYTSRPIAHSQAIKVAVDKIQNAQSPILLVGMSALRKKTCHALRAFVEQFKIPFITTQMAKGVIDERSDYFLGNAAISEGDYVHKAIRAADLIINVGYEIEEKPPFLMQRNRTEVLHINFSGANIDEIYFPQVEVIGDITHSIKQISQGLTSQASWDHNQIFRIKEAADKHQQNNENARYPMYPQRMVSDIRSSLNDEAIITLDNGMYKIWFARNYKTFNPNTILLDNALATMGAGLPAAIAAKLCDPRKTVVAICGDGGFLMNCQELETAIRLNLHIVIILLRDDALGMIKWKQSNMGLANFGLDYSNPEYVEFAKSFGAFGHKVSSADELKPILKSSINTPGVHLIDVMVDYSDTEKDLEAIKNAVRKL